MKFDQIIAERKNKTIYRDGDRCIKMFNKDYSKADILNEALNNARVEEIGIRIPAVLEVTMIDGQWAIAFEYIEGKTFADLMEENPADKNKYLEMMVDIQMDIHEKRCPLLTNHRDKMTHKIALTEFNHMTKYELRAHLDGMPRHNKVCHGDLHPSDIIVMPDGKYCILDWAHVTKGNASADVARTYLVFLLNNRKEEGEYYLKTFCKKADTPRQYVERWLQIVAASQSLKAKDNEGEMEYLSKIVNVVQF